MGWIVSRHGALYAKEYGWDERLEALTAEIVAAFIRNYDHKRERCWIAERDGENVGSVLLVKDTDEVARLRLLLVEPQARGLGIGARLVEEALRFAREARYRKVTLWTHSVLTRRPPHLRAGRLQARRQRKSTTNSARSWSGRRGTWSCGNNRGSELSDLRPHAAKREPRLSLRAELVRLGLRWFVKRKTGPRDNGRDGAPAARASSSRLVPAAAEGNADDSTSTSTGSRPSRVATRESLSDRHILYLHGGGHVSGSPRALSRFHLAHRGRDARPRRHPRSSARARASRFRRRSTMPSRPTGRCWPMAPIRGEWR